LLAAAGATSPAPLRPLPVVLSLAAPAQRRRGTIRRGDGLTGSADDAAVEAARDSDRPCYQVAADAGDAQDPAVLPTMAEITLTSEDGRWGVRIKPDPQGEGAIAILVPRRQGAVLRLGGVEHLFDEDGIAHLPSSPIGAAFLILS
ncbi:MAG: hypothetical protein QUU85_02095, partial [Candidatus Eisenbacteria bacterium]|nr:hypothetical protein [Candidatus Eisenbacteria bacterium]